MGAIGAERFFSEERAGRRVGAGAAAAADRFVAAVAALAFVGGRIPELCEYLRVIPDVGEALHARVAAAHRQVAARKHFAFVRYEADARARQTAACHR